MSNSSSHSDNKEKWFKTTWGIGLITAAATVLAAVIGVIGAQMRQDRSPQPDTAITPTSSLASSTTSPLTSASTPSTTTTETTDQGAGQLLYKDKKLAVGNPCASGRRYYIGLDTGVVAPPVSSPEYHSIDGVFGCDGTTAYLQRQQSAAFSDPVPAEDAQTAAQCATAVEQHPTTGRLNRIALRGRQTVCSDTNEGAIAAVHLQTTAARVSLVVTAWHT